MSKIDFSVDGNRVRQLVKQIAKKDITSAQGETFLELFGTEVFEELSKTARAVIARHFGVADRSGAE